MLPPLALFSGMIFAKSLGMEPAGDESIRTFTAVLGVATLVLAIAIAATPRSIRVRHVLFS